MTRPSISRLRIGLSIRTPGQALAFLLALVLLTVSLYPLFVMMRTSLQTVGDPFKGTPREIVIAEAARGNLTMQNQPMTGGFWDPKKGFSPDDHAWSLSGDNLLQNKSGAAFIIHWEGDLRRYARLVVDGAATASWSVAWQDVSGSGFMEDFTDGNATQVSLPSESDFDVRNVASMILIPKGDNASWSKIRIVPKRLTLANYLDVWKADRFSRYTLNSVIVSLIITLGSIVTSLCAGYAFARGELRSKPLFWGVMVGSMLIPAEALLVPAFLILQHFPFFGGNDAFGQGGIGLLDSYAGLTLPSLVSPVGIFLVRQSLLSLPDSYEEAAVMDGANMLQVLWHVIAPLQRPILATIGLLTFLFSWNSFIFPLIIIQSPEMRTLPVGLALYSAKNTVDWVHLMAASAMTAIPIFIVFALFNRQLIAGLIHDGVKG